MPKLLLARLMAVVGLAVLFVPFVTSAEEALNLDKDFGTVSGWKVGFSDGRGGCLAAATFDNETTFWVGYTGENNAVYVAFTNPNWSSIETDGGYDIQIRTNSRRWNGRFFGFGRRNEKGIYNVGLKDDFVQDLAASRDMRLFVNGKQFFSPSLSGLRNALKAVISCQNKYVQAASGEERRGGEKGASFGSGFFVTAKGHVLTNAHVVEGCKEATVLQSGVADTLATVIARDTTNDLAILKTTTDPTVVPAVRTQIKVGESVYVYGFPLPGLLATSGNFTMGSITAVTGLGDDSRQFQISAPVHPGNSGGPVLDKNGNVIGVVVGKLNALKMAASSGDIPQNINFAIKSGIAINFLNSNDIMSSERERTTALAPENIAEIAKFFTVKIVCK
jgi:hypothetical protein